MSAETHTDDRTDHELPTSTSASDSAATAPAGRADPLDAHPDVEIAPKPSAHCCGALGCHEKTALLEVVIDGYGTRVVCPGHAEYLVGRETT